MHALDVDDVRAVDAEEDVGVELGLDGVHGLAEEVRVGADVQLDVVAGRLDPVDLVGAHEEDAAAGLDDEALEPLRVRLEILDELEEAPFEIAVRRTLQLLRGRARAPRGSDGDRTA